MYDLRSGEWIELHYTPHLIEVQGYLKQDDDTLHRCLYIKHVDGDVQVNFGTEAFQQIVYEADLLAYQCVGDGFDHARIQFNGGQPPTINISYPGTTVRGWIPTDAPGCLIQEQLDGIEWDQKPDIADTIERRLFEWAAERETA